MITYKKINRAIHKGINLNPHKIKVKEKGKLLVEGAYNNINTVREIIGIVYPLKSNKLEIETSQIATSFVNSNFEMICDEKADIKSETGIRTTIECTEGQFSVTYVNPVVVEDKIAGYLCGLERID